MAKQGAKSAVPRLRFPEFRGGAAWKEEKLEKLIETITPPAKLPSSNYLATGEFPIIDQSQDPICGWTDDARAVVKGPLPVIVFGDHTCVLKFVDRPFVQGADGIKILAAKPEVSIRYLFHSLNHQPLVMEDYKRHFSALKERQIFFPDIDSGEQQKIADCLTSLDEVIAAQGRKVEALKSHKRGLMQQLFPREGETRPRLRFPEFRDAPEWEVSELVNVCEVLNNRRVPIAGGERRAGPYPYYGASGVVDYVDNFIFDERLLLVGEDGAKWGAFEATAFIVDGKYWVNNHAHVLRPTIVIDTLLENYLTMIDLAGYVSGHAPPKLTLAKLKSIPILFPASKLEQQRIADCLSSLDTQIAAEANQLAALKIHKQGLMQQLFPTQGPSQ